MDSKLTSENVTRLFLHCLFKGNEEKIGYKLVHGITMSTGFHPIRLKENKPIVANMLLQLPEEFHMGTGNSFVYACETKNGVNWGCHKHVEQLLLLGLATELVKYTVPKSMWVGLPGGLPYFAVSI